MKSQVQPSNVIRVVLGELHDKPVRIAGKLLTSIKISPRKEDLVQNAWSGSHAAQPATNTPT
jgi:hypothetical protein